jgi:hypothetical protein
MVCMCVLLNSHFVENPSTWSCMTPVFLWWGCYIGLKFGKILNFNYANIRKGKLQQTTYKWGGGGIYPPTKIYCSVKHLEGLSFFFIFPLMSTCLVDHHHHAWQPCVNKTWHVASRHSSNVYLTCLVNRTSGYNCKSKKLKTCKHLTEQ